MKSFKSFLNEAQNPVDVVYLPDKQFNPSSPDKSDKESAGPSRQTIQQGRERESAESLSAIDAVDLHRDEILSSARQGLETAMTNKNLEGIQNIVGKDAVADISKIEGMKRKQQEYGYPSIHKHVENLMDMAAKHAVDTNPEINDPKQLIMMAHEHMMSTSPHYKSATDSIKNMGMEKHLPYIASVHFGRNVNKYLPSRDTRLKTKAALNAPSAGKDEIPY
jgi:hypothetical protein